MQRLLVCFTIIAALPLAAQDTDQEARIAELERKVEHLYEDHNHDDQPRARLLDLSFNLMAAGGTSTSTDAEIRRLQAGNHDPRRRGFTLQQAELAFAGAIEPWFAGEAYLVAREDTVELEEAFLRSLSLPWLELKAGYYFTEFGRINRLHPHQWRWADQPVVTGRLLSPEGMRGAGLRVALEPPLPLRWIVSVQNASDASMISFLGQGHDHGAEHESEEEHDEHGEHEEGTIGGWPRHERPVRALGDLLYSTRLELGAATEAWDFQFGLSGAYGPNATGDTGKTWLAGADLLVRWGNEDLFAQVEGELIYRYFQADRAAHEDEVLDSNVLSDWGTWVEFYAGFGAWRAGLRLEHAAGFRSGELQRSEDAMRDNRYRMSPMVGWQPIEMVHVTLQYNFDYAQHIGGDTSHSVWLGIRLLFGIHKHLH